MISLVRTDAVKVLAWSILHGTHTLVPWDPIRLYWLACVTIDTEVCLIIKPCDILLKDFKTVHLGWLRDEIHALILAHILLEKLTIGCITTLGSVKLDLFRILDTRLFHVNKVG